MELGCVYSIGSLPESARTVLQNAPVFYSGGYARFAAACGQTPVYLYSEDYLMLALLGRQSFFRFADLPVEYLTLRPDPAGAPQKFLDECVMLLRRRFGLQWINCTHPAAIFEECPTRCLRIPFGSMIVDLTRPEEALWAGLHVKHRNAVRRARRGGVEIRLGDIGLLPEYLRLEQGVQAGNGPEIERFCGAMPGHVLIALAVKDGKPQGGAVFLYSPARSYYLFSVSVEHPEPGAMTLLHWRAMLALRACGTVRHSFVGYRIGERKHSRYGDIQRFHARFGGELKVGFMFKVVLNRPCYTLFRFLTRCKTGRPVRDPVDQEIRKWPKLNGRH